MKIILTCLLGIVLYLPVTAQYVSVADTAAMLHPYLRKADTLSLSNRIKALSGKTLQDITDKGSITTHEIAAASFTSKNINLNNTATDQNAVAGVAFYNLAAAPANQQISNFIENTQAGGGGTSHYYIRHNNYDGASGYYNLLDYTMDGENSTLQLGGPSGLAITTAGVNRFRVTSAGRVGINTTSPLQQLHVKGNTAVEEGRLLVNTTTDNGYTLQVNGQASVTGNMGIGVVAAENATDKLMVNGNIRAKKILVSLTGWGDYVFDSTYRLRSINEVAAYVQKYRHLPDMQPAKEIEKQGLDMGEVIKQQQVKIEELTLYIIQQAKQQEALEKQVELLLQQIAEKK